MATRRAQTALYTLSFLSLSLDNQKIPRLMFTITRGECQPESSWDDSITAILLRLTHAVRGGEDDGLLTELKNAAPSLPPLLRTAVLHYHNTHASATLTWKPMSHKGRLDPASKVLMKSFPLSRYLCNRSFIWDIRKSLDFTRLHGRWPHMLIDQSEWA